VTRAISCDTRLVYCTIANYTTDQKLWVLETRSAMSNIWAVGYCFSELEFLPEDFVHFNYRTYDDPTSWFTYRLIVTKVLLDEQGGEEAVGTVTLIGDTLNKRVEPNAAEDVVVCKSERERVEKWFGVKLKDEDYRHGHRDSIWMNWTSPIHDVRCLAGRASYTLTPAVRCTQGNTSECLPPIFRVI